ncbi:hypothetical protein [Sphingomonas taxi]|uniref:hypothetical protein n=1 Tax=Sphingomonas taxi TaxID=1549858 RepID=UPI0012DFF7F9|nr:hypothetical protein [Sphingomonas taxi]
MNSDLIALQVARLVANLLLFIEGSDEDAIENDTAVHIIEQIFADLESLDKLFLRKLITAFENISPEYDDGDDKFVRDIPVDLSLDPSSLDDD